MGLCLGFESALQYWLTKRGDEAIPEAADTGRFAHSEASSRLLAHEYLPLEPSVNRSLHLLVPNQALKHRLDNIVVHACSSKLPAGSFCRLGGDNLVASPALTFLQMAPRHSLWELVEIGCYLCSKFSISERGRDYVGEREQLVTLDELRRYIDSLPNRAYGKRQAARALSYVVELTASPKETHLAMHYGMPPNLGGRGPSPSRRISGSTLTSTVRESSGQPISSETCISRSTRATSNMTAWSFTPAAIVLTTRRPAGTFSRRCKSKPSRQLRAR